MNLSQALLVFVSILIPNRGEALSPDSTRQRPPRNMDPSSVVRIPQRVWRSAAAQHRTVIRRLLEPGLLALDPKQTAARETRRQRRRAASVSTAESTHDIEDWIAPLNTQHPVYNFLSEYYGLKGSKGPRQLSRWSPSCGLLLQDKTEITSVEELIQISSCQEPVEGSKVAILLEGAVDEDFASILHLRGATILSNEQSDSNSGVSTNSCSLPDGVLYSPAHFFGKDDADRAKEASRLATPFLWYKAILEQTLSAEPILHCHGLHEWAMQYHPPNAPPPPSAKYQSHLQLRVSRETINAAVERRGISCTHVDALRFFAPAAGPLNHHGASLERTDQIRLEQPACVHAHMDLLKISLKLRPFCDPTLLQRVLEVALESRRLDVAASPYDATSYNVGIVPIETKEGRAMYREQQRALMEKAEPIRKDLLHAYNSLIHLAFDESTVSFADRNPLAERFAKAEPGGQPWKKNLIESG